MPRYFFHSEDGAFVRDREGIELANEDDARVEAVRLAGETLRDRPQELWETQRWRLLVAPATGPALFGIEVTPVTGRHLVPWQRE